MPYQFNIFNIKINEIGNNGNVVFGASVQNSHTANNKWIGVNFSFGDVSPANSLILNNSVDPDVSDQDQITNVSVPVSNQI